jgi:hypothetical protein
MVTPEAEATIIATPAVTHVAASTLATGLTRYATQRELPTSTTMMASPRSQLDYVLSWYPRSSSLLGSPSTT